MTALVTPQRRCLIALAAPRELDAELRVDLHPRFSQDGRTICIDSAMNGSRAIYTLDISPITEASTPKANPA